MTLTVLDPRTGKRVTINLPDEPSHDAEPVCPKANVGGT